MEIFTANQVNQVYVVNDVLVSGVLSKSDDLGTLKVCQTPKGELYFQHLGAGGITRSDIINPKNILHYTVTDAENMRRKLKYAMVKLDSSLVSSNKLLVSGDYILTIKFNQVIGLSPEHQYWKYGVVYGVKDMLATDFYKKLAISLAQNMAREATKLVSIYLAKTSGDVEVTSNTKENDLTESYIGVVIKEVEQDWILGLKQQRPVSFTVEPSNIEFNTPDFVWGKVTYDSYSYVGNGKKMADYEYFYMGERADQYRMAGYPNYVPTKYLVDPTKEYDTISIHYAYTGANHAVQMSEKDITIITPSGNSSYTSAIVKQIDNILNPTESEEE